MTEGKLSLNKWTDSYSEAIQQAKRLLDQASVLSQHEIELVQVRDDVLWTLLEELDALVEQRADPETVAHAIAKVLNRMDSFGDYFDVVQEP